MSDLFEGLKHAIAAGKVVAVVGTGVSLASTQGESRKLAGWAGLLRHGLEHCAEYGSAPISPATLDSYRNDLDSKSPSLDTPQPSCPCLSRAPTQVRPASGEVVAPRGWPEHVHGCPA
jgi:hypothetical protein